jgi:hypothetical protein
MCATLEPILGVGGKLSTLQFSGQGVSEVLSGGWVATNQTPPTQYRRAVLAD